MSNYSMPLIRITMQDMEHSIIKAFNEFQVERDTMLLDTVKRFCEPGNVQRIIDQEVYRVLDIVIKEEVSNFFRYGDGREIISKKVKEKLLNNETYTPVDEGVG